MNTFLENNRTILRFFFILLFIVVLLAPGYVFFTNRGGLSFLRGAETFKEVSLLIFPLFGLYAFTLVWIQLMIGSNMGLLTRVFRSIRNYHKQQGKVAFLFALIHPNLLILSIGLSEYFRFRFVDPSLKIYLFFGVFAYYSLILTATTAILMRISFLRKAWRYIHYLNYLIFVAVWFHSWFLGSDVQSSNLKYLWIFYGITALATTVFRILRAFNRPTANLQSVNTNG